MQQVGTIREIKKLVGHKERERERERNVESGEKRESLSIGVPF